MHSAETSFLIGFEGTEVTTEANFEFQLPTKTWIVTEKLEEVSLFINRHLDTDDSLKPRFAAGKFLCYLKDDATKEPAFMRIYYQIPTSGTERSPSKDRAAQGVLPIELTELTAFKSLMKQACPVVPRLLGYREGKQPDDGITPGGFATTIVWEKVPGVPLSQRFFWNLDQNQHDDIPFRISPGLRTTCTVRPPAISSYVFEARLRRVYRKDICGIRASSIMAYLRISNGCPC